MGDDRYERGRQRLAELAGERGESVMAAVEEVSPDLARYVIEFGYGDIYSRPHSRRPCPSARRHLGPLGDGRSGAAARVPHRHRTQRRRPAGTDIVETVLFLSPFIGFARTLNAVRSVKRVFASRDLLRT